MPGQSGTVDATAVAGTGTGLVRAIRWDPTDEGRRVAGGEGVARHQRARRLCIGHAVGRADAPLSRVARRRAAHAVRPHRDVERHLGADPLSGRASRVAAQHDRHGPAGKEFDAARWLIVVPARSRPPRVDLRCRERPHREARADAAPPEHDAHQLSAAVERAGSPGAASARRIPPARSAGQSSRCSAVRSICAGRSLRVVARRRSAAAAHVSSTAMARRSRSCPRRFDHAVYALEQNRGYECCGDLWTPGYFRFELVTGRAGNAGRVDRSRGKRSARSIPSSLPQRGAGAAHTSDRHRAAGAVDGPGRGAGACSRSIRHHARGPNRGSGARPRGRRRGPHGDRRATTGSPTGAATR